MYTRQDLLNRLHGDICRVTFTKVNGDVRVMNCTLKSDVLPPPEPIVEGVEKKERKVSETTIRVWDVDLKEWRSFVIDNVTEVA